MEAPREVAERLTDTYGRIAKSLALVGVGIGFVYGCGGGSSASGSNTGPTVQSEIGTAVFQVDLVTRKVTVTRLGASRGAGRAIVGGSAVGFNSSVLLDLPGAGDTGLKTLNVSMTNNFGLPLGVNQDGAVQGLRVIFSNFTAQNVPSDIRSLTTVSTAAGTGANGTGDGAVGSATFNAPAGVAAAAGPIEYVTDYNAGSLRKIASGSVTTITTGMVHPYGAAINPVDGAIIVADAGANKIYRMTTGGSRVTIAGTGAAGSANGSGNTATFNSPTGIAVDSSGNIFVSDSANNRIRVIRYQGGGSTVASNYVVSALSGSGAAGSADGSAAGASFNSPAGLAVDTSGRLYVADMGSNEIRAVDASGAVVTIAGTGTASETDGRGDGATFNSPRGVAFVNGVLVVSDGVGNTIRQITLPASGTASSAGSWVQTLAGTGSAGSGNGTGDVSTFTTPSLIGVDPTGSVFIPDTGSHLVRKIVPTSGSFPLGAPSAPGPTTAVVLSNPSGGVPSSGAGASSPFISYPTSIASGATSSEQPWNFVIAPGVTNFQFTVTVEASSSILTGPTSDQNQGAADSQVRTLAGKANSFGFVDGVATAARFGSFVQGLGTDRAGDIFIADFHNNSIRCITPDGTVSVIAGTLSTGGGSAIDGVGTVARFNGPSAIAVTPDGQVVYVGDANNNKIRRIALQPGADRRNPANWVVSTIAGSGTQSTADGPGNTASLVLPEGVALDPTGNIYVSEDAGNRIKRVTFQGGDPTLSTNYQVRTVAGDTSTTFPATNFVDATGTAARFADPVEIACDVQGNVYIADSFNNRIRKMDPGGVVTTVAGSTSGYLDGTGTAARFSQPNGLAIDSAGYLYIADTSGNVIRRVSPAGVVTTIAGTGTSGSLDGVGNAATFASPFGITVNRTGDVIVGGTDGALRLIQRVITP